MPSENNLIIRRATENDTSMLAQFRVALHKEIGNIENEIMEKDFFELCLQAIPAALNSGAFIAWLAEIGHQPVATAVVSPYYFLPYPNNESGKELYFLNSYTSPNYRRKGIMSALINERIAYAKANRFHRIWLHAEPHNQELLKKAGFKFNNHIMVLYI